MLLLQPPVRDLRLLPGAFADAPEAELKQEKAELRGYGSAWRVPLQALYTA